MTQWMYSGLTGLAISLVMGPFLLPLLKKWKFGQTIRDEGPKRHMEKSGTPTMGGILFVTGAVVSVLMFASPDSQMALFLIAILGFGGIGFLDDFIKVVLKRNLGLRAWQKIALQLLVALVIAAMGSIHVGTELWVPFLKVQWDLGLFYIPFQVFVLLSFVNAVNLTDGLDGLAAGVSVWVFSIFIVLAQMFSWNSVGIFASAVVGSLLGFLPYNIHPAKVFMGDTGSMALGGALGALIVITATPLILLIGGGVFFLETLSVAMQVVYFKVTKGKRIFKMTPIHHHFELSGWSEWKVVGIFWLVAALFSLLALYSIL